MGQKVHPRGFRVGITEPYSSVWFEEPRNYRKQVEVDAYLRRRVKEEFMNSRKIANFRISKIEIENIFEPVTLEEHQKGTKRTSIQIRIFTPNLLEPFTQQFAARPEVKALTFELSQRFKTSITILFLTVDTPDGDAKLLAESIVETIRKRRSFRGAMKKAVEKATRRYCDSSGVWDRRVEGIKIRIAGRLNGAEIARSEWVRHGRVPLHSLRARIDYAKVEAYTAAGILGISVWVHQKPSHEVINHS